jgi:DNA-binding PadR family transcriptional regulator
VSSITSTPAPEYAVLGFLYLRPMHGYDLHRLLQANLREVWRISQAQVYNILKRLEKLGWISASLQPQEHRPDRECFTLTPTGKNHFEDWLYRPTASSARAIRVELLARLFFASQVDDAIVSRLLQEQAAATRADVAALQQRLDALPLDQVYNRLGLELRLRQLAVFVDWMDSCELNLLT